MKMLLKNRPQIGQILRWIDPEESPYNDAFLKAKKVNFPGELKVHQIMERPHKGKGGFSITITHDGEVVTSALGSHEPSEYDPMWFHWDGEYPPANSPF